MCTQVWAISLSDLSDKDAGGGLKEALSQGASKAVALLGKQDGFLKNPKVKIPMPDGLRQAEKLMRTFGMKKQADELITSMNRAAEAAVPEAKELLVGAVKDMSVEDAKKILTGGETSGTEYFKGKTSAQLKERFKPIVQKAMDKVGLAKTYEKFASKGAQYGVISKEDADLDNYVTQKTLDGLFTMVAEEEKAIRKNPVGAAGDLAKKVFGALGK
ncbi:Putative exported protein [Methyloversatilis universalis FAM5]|uniref:Exported protein n=2 Tax=Methyloversatilis universalis TaxID=378211 RepID=F5RFE3_METUF|nr:Putative exported protein [Methyloversatilis universalis FAM5]